MITRIGPAKVKLKQNQLMFIIIHKKIQLVNLTGSDAKAVGLCDSLVFTAKRNVHFDHREGE